MDNEDDHVHRPGTSKEEESAGRKPSECPKAQPRLNNNDLNGYADSEFCGDCIEDLDYMTAASLVYCDQEDNSSASGVSNGDDGDDEDDDFDDRCCVYTYCGDRQEPAINDLPVNDRSASPLMDYLEMDFEPEAAVGEDEAVNGAVNDNEESEEEPMPSSSTAATNKQDDCEKTCEVSLTDKDSTKQTNGKFVKRPTNTKSTPSVPPHTPTKSIPSPEERNGCLRRTGETLEVCQKMKRMRVDDLTWVKEMIWSEDDATQYRVNQIGVSACGATSVINTLLALSIPFSVDRIVRTIGTRLRDETAPLIPYLESRAVAGCMPQDLVRTLETASDSLVSARFFATHPNLDMHLAPWLAGWIKKGAIPILTLNLQRGAMPHTHVPDSWHHQMMYGVAFNPLSPEIAQFYLTNPLSQSSLVVLKPQLLSPSSLMIKREDVLSRWNLQTDLMPLATHPNRLWHRSNVLGQVVNLLREEMEGIKVTNHIVIPANYKSGITLAIKTSSNYSHELKSVPELPNGDTLKSYCS